MDLMQILAWPLGWVMWLFYHFLGNSYVLSLVLFTIVIRAILLPSAIKQQRNTAKMSVFQPEIRKIQKQHGNNKQKIQEETTKLYEREGYNPMSGCLPTLIQLPIIYGLFNVVYNPITHLLRDIADSPFIKNALTALTSAKQMSSPQIELIKILGDPDAAISALQIAEPAKVTALHSAVAAIPPDISEKIQSVDLNFLGLNLGDIPQWGTWLIIIPILSCLSAFAVSIISTKLSSRNMGPQAGMGMMKGMMYLMPLMSFFIAFSVPGGVGLYWTISNVFAGAQSFVLYKIFTPEKMLEIVEHERKLMKSGKIKKKQSFMSKMQAAQANAVEQQGAARSNTNYESLSDKEANKQRLKDARMKMAEKYGDTYKDEE